MFKGRVAWCGCGGGGIGGMSVRVAARLFGFEAGRLRGAVGRSVSGWPLASGCGDGISSVGTRDRSTVGLGS